MIRALYPRLQIVGHGHGYLRGPALGAKVREIKTLAPDFLWIGMGAARAALAGVVLDEPDQCRCDQERRCLFNHLSEKIPRAPQWRQRAGLEWLWRMLLEPKRLSWRYPRTDQCSPYLLLTNSG